MISCRFRYSFQHLVEAETSDFLTRWKLFECRKKAADVLLCRHQKEETLRSPSFIIHSLLVSNFERIRTQIENLRKTQWNKRVLPYIHSVSTLLCENNFPLVVSHRYKRTIIVELMEQKLGRKIDDISKLSRYEGMLLKGIQKALSGDTKAMAFILRRYDDAEAVQSRDEPIPSEQDEMVYAALVEKIKRELLETNQ